MNRHSVSTVAPSRVKRARRFPAQLTHIRSDHRLDAVNPVRAYFGLGSNLGDREAELAAALAGLARRAAPILAVSSYYETEPVGGPPQGWFLNAVAVADVALAPEALLAACRAVEHERGRIREVRDGPRTLDVDILLYGDAVTQHAELILPHPRMHERRFVLEPLAELAPGLRHPVLGLTVAELLARCPDTATVLRRERVGP